MQGLKLIANFLTSWKSLQTSVTVKSVITLIAVPLTEQQCQKAILKGEIISNVEQVKTHIYSADPYFLALLLV